MTGKHSTKSREPLIEQPPPPMPDPDNLMVDVSKLPTTGPVGISRPAPGPAPATES